MKSIIKRARPASLRPKAGPVGALLLLVAALFAGVWNYLDWAHARDRSALQRETVEASERLLSALKDLETGQRGYLLVGNEQFLDPYRAALSSLDARLDEVRTALERAEAPAADFARIKDIVDRKRSFAEETVEARRRTGFTAALALVAEGRGKEVMDEARAETDRLQARARTEEVRVDQSVARRSLWISLASFALALAAVGYFAWLAVVRRRENERTTALLDGVLENAPIGLGFLDRGLRIRHMNRALAAMSDRTMGADVGQEMWDLLPDVRDKVEPLLRSVIDRGQIHSSVEIEVPAQRAGRRARHLVLSLYPLREAGVASPAGVGLVIMDATTRKQAERRLQDSERRFRTLITATVAMVWTTGPEGTFVTSQTDWCTYTGQSPEEIEGTGWLEAIHPDDRELTATAWRRAVDLAALYKVEHRVKRHDGQWRHMLVRAVPIFAEDDTTILEWVGTSTDITERKDMEIELEAARESAEQANRAKSQFIANMSHELRTPLSAVIGYSEMLQEELEDRGEAELMVDMQKIESNARHLLGLINDVLDLSKIEAEKMEIFPETFSIADMVRDVAATVDALVTKKDNAFDVAIAAEDSLGTMHSDETKVRQCLINLLSNASKFTERGRITLAVSREALDGHDWISFSVTDTGIGMTEEQLSKLFERFAQADASTTRKFGGSGLGLAITRSFCEMLGGEIDVKSAYGEGTTFRIRLPADVPALVDGTPGDERTGDARQSTSERPDDCVLIVDDDAATRDLLERFLGKEGFPVRSAPDGRAGLDLARRLRPRVILLDVTMPRMDGWSVLRTLKSDPELSKIPVVMVTIIDEQNLAFTLGATDYLAKPIEWDRLKDVMDRYKGGEARGTALVVDDDPDARDRLTSLLHRNGWATAQAENGRAALDLVTRAKPALILLDLMMPEMDGFAFLRELRANVDWRDIPVVVLTAKDITSEDRRRLDPAADKIIQKGSLSLKDLAQEIRVYLPNVPAVQASGP